MRACASRNASLADEVRSARGNTSLESALTLTKAIRHGIEKLGKHMEGLSDQMAKRKTSPEEIKSVVDEIKSLLSKIEEVQPSHPRARPMLTVPGRPVHQSRYRYLGRKHLRRDT